MAGCRVLAVGGCAATWNPGGARAVRKQGTRAEVWASHQPGRAHVLPKSAGCVLVPPGVPGARVSPVHSERRFCDQGPCFETSRDRPGREGLRASGGQCAGPLACGFIAVAGEDHRHTHNGRKRNRQAWGSQEGTVSRLARGGKNDEHVRARWARTSSQTQQQLLGSCLGP